VRDEIAAVLGCEACVAEVLRALCDKRLIPTPWLNQACCRTCALRQHCLLRACMAPAAAHLGPGHVHAPIPGYLAPQIDEASSSVPCRPSGSRCT
jgi:hypothetical protein